MNQWCHVANAYFNIGGNVYFLSISYAGGPTNTTVAFYCVWQVVSSCYIAMCFFICQDPYAAETVKGQHEQKVSKTKVLEAEAPWLSYSYM